MAYLSVHIFRDYRSGVPPMSNRASPDNFPKIEIGTDDYQKINASSEACQGDPTAPDFADKCFISMGSRAGTVRSRTARGRKRGAQSAQGSSHSPGTLHTRRT